MNFINLELVIIRKVRV